MNHVPGFEEEFQGCYIIDLDDYRRRKRQGSGQAPAAREKARTPTTPHIVTLMKKSLEFHRLRDDGEGTNRAALARCEGITRARVTQIMKLLRLPPEIQATILALPAGTPERLVTERKLRELVDLGAEEQREAFAAMVGRVIEKGPYQKKRAG